MSENLSPAVAHLPASVILTIGHSTRSVGKFIHLLQAHGATMVVDILSATRTEPHALTPFAHLDGLRITYPQPPKGDEEMREF